MKFKKIIITVFLTVFFFNLVSSQTPLISVEHSGYGKTPREVYLNIKNIGNIPLSNISIIVDGEIYKTIQGTLNPDKRIGTVVYLDPGKHTIGVGSPEGAYDSIELTISSQEEKKIIMPRTFIEKNKTLISVVIIIVIFGLVAWITTQKPKLF